MKSLSDLWAESRENEFEAKVAAVTEAYDGDEVRIELLNQAVDLIKEAEANEDIVELDACDTFTLAVSLVEDMLKEAAEDEEAEDSDDKAEEKSDEKKDKKKGKAEEKDDDKEAMDKEAELDEDELTKEAEAEYMALGEMVGELLEEQGLSLDDLEKVAEEDVVAFGTWCGQELIRRVEAE